MVKKFINKSPKVVQQALSNKYVLYAVLLFSVGHVIGYIQLGQWDALALYMAGVVVMSYFSKNMIINLLVAICMVYLLMAILFESFVYPLVIMLSVPPAAAGGVMGLWVLNLNILQPLDMLTILGFVILIGIVVNNAILLVHQTLQHIA